VTTHKITLPGPPVSAEVSWDMVRAYLTREGWLIAERYADGGEAWSLPSGPGVVWVGVDITTVANGIVHAVGVLARLASVSPGEMLARIAGQVEPSRLAQVCADYDALRANYRDVCDAHRAGYAAAEQRAAEDMRERCVEYVRGMLHDPDAAIAAIRALPIPGQPSPSFYGANPIPIPSTDLSPPPDLWAQVRARLASHSIQITAEYRDATSAVPRYVATWRSASGQYRQEERASEAECLRLVLAIEDTTLCVSGCVRREAEGAGHPGARREKL